MSLNVIYEQRYKRLFTWQNRVWDSVLLRGKIQIGGGQLVKLNTIIQKYKNVIRLRIEVLRIKMKMYCNNTEVRGT